MARHHVSSNVLHILVLAVIFGCTTASRTLMQVAQCGSFLTAQDIPGANLPGSGQSTASNQACVDLCSSTPTCNAAVRNTGTFGSCYLKSVNVNNVVPVAAQGFVAYLKCTTPPTTPPPPPQTNCNTFLQMTDIPGNNLPGAGQSTASNQACVDLCSSTPTCNAAIRNSGTFGSCYLKSVNVNTVVPVTAQDFTSYINCNTPPPAPAPSPAPSPGDAEAVTFFGVPAGTCPGPNITPTIGGTKLTTVGVPVQARPFYTGPDSPEMMNANNEILLTYMPLNKGGTYCYKAPQAKVTVGGTLMFSTGAQCRLPPTKSDGSSCCTLYTWQPSTAGYYYGDCSMKMQIGADGVYWFDTENAGNEAQTGWGPDPEPHIHFDVTCSGCSEFDFLFGSKFYIGPVWTAGGGQPQHGALKTTFKGQDAYKYNLIFPTP